MNFFAELRFFSAGIDVLNKANNSTYKNCFCSLWLGKELEKCKAKHALLQNCIHHFTAFLLLPQFLSHKGRRITGTPKAASNFHRTWPNHSIYRFLLQPWYDYSWLLSQFSGHCCSSHFLLFSLFPIKKFSGLCFSDTCQGRGLRCCHLNFFIWNWKNQNQPNSDHNKQKYFIYLWRFCAAAAPCLNEIKISPAPFWHKTVLVLLSKISSHLFQV